MSDTTNEKFEQEDLPFINVTYLENILLPLYFNTDTTFDDLTSEDFAFLHKRLVSIREFAERIVKIFNDRTQTQNIEFDLVPEETLLAYFVMSELQAKELINHHPQSETLRNVLFYTQVFAPVHTPSVTDLMGKLLDP